MKKNIFLIFIVITCSFCGQSQKLNEIDLLEVSKRQNLFNATLKEEVNKMIAIGTKDFNLTDSTSINFAKVYKVQEHFRKLLFSSLTEAIIAEQAKVYPTFLVEYTQEFWAKPFKQKYIALLFLFGEESNYIFRFEYNEGNNHVSYEKIDFNEKTDCNYDLWSALFYSIHCNRNLLFTAKNEYQKPSGLMTHCLTYTQISDNENEPICRIIPDPLHLSLLLAIKNSNSLNPDELVNERYLLERIRKMFILLEDCTSFSIPTVPNGIR